MVARTKGIAVALLLAGCAATQPTAPGVPGSAAARSEPAAQSPRVANRNLSGFSTAFRQGYLDGCRSVSGGQQRDEGRYKAEMDYMIGWNDGFSSCRR